MLQGCSIGDYSTNDISHHSVGEWQILNKPISSRPHTCLAICVESSVWNRPDLFMLFDQLEDFTHASGYATALPSTEDEKVLMRACMFQPARLVIGSCLGTDALDANIGTPGNLGTLIMRPLGW